MSKFDRVLSDAELISATFKAEAEGTMGELRAVEQAVLAKLAKQEPVAWRVTAKQFCGDTTKHRDTAEYWEEREPGCVIPLYAAPQPTNSAQIRRNLIRALALKNGFTLKGGDLHEYVYNFANELVSVVADSTLFDKSTKNHVVGNNEMVADMYWINPDYPSYTSILDAFDPVQSAVEVEIGDQFEVGRAKTLPDLIIEVTELEENGDVKDFKVLSGDYIVDSNKMVTPLTQRKIQSVIDSGEYREMKGATVLVSEEGRAAIVNHGGAFYWVDNEVLAREFDAAGAENTGENT